MRVFERFSTLNGASSGRAEVILGRGSFVESFPLFSYDLKEYNFLFEEKVALFVELQKGGPVTWHGSTRSGLREQRVFPTLDTPLPTWVGVGGSPESVARAARYQLPMTLAMVGGTSLRFSQILDYYRQSLAAVGADQLPIAVHSFGYVADTDEIARTEHFPYWKMGRDRIGAERGWAPETRSSYDLEIANGTLYVGSPETVAHKIARTATALGFNRFIMRYSAGALPHEKLMQCVALYGSRVIPLVRDLMEE